METDARSGTLNGAKELYAQIFAEYKKLENELKTIRQKGNLSN
jgi:hypothetical protein